MKSFKKVKDKLNIRRRVSKKKIRAVAAALFAVILASFAAAVFLNNIRKKTDEPDGAYPGRTALPRISFLAKGREINTLTGYTNPMEITAVRDTITPVPEDGILTVIVKNISQRQEALDYEIYSLNGEKLIWREDTPVKEDGTAVLNLKDLLPANKERERALKLILHVGEGEEQSEVCYFTRIICDRDLSIKQCMDFAKDFHDKTFDKGAKEELSHYLEPDPSADNYTLAHVTIHCDTDQVTWGKMSPNVTGDVEWRIMEANPVCTSLQAVYKVKVGAESGEAEYYNVKEFFRVRYLDKEMYLLNYDRTMGRIFTPRGTLLADEGIFLGIAPEDTQYAVSPNGKVTAFVSEGALWVFNRETMELYLVFSFSDGEGRDGRCDICSHDIRIIGMEENGSMVFTVYGYMDSGKHEGEVGASLCYFDIEKNTAVEKAFMPSSKSCAAAEHEPGKIVYYAHKREMLYVISGGKLFEIDLEKNSNKASEADLSGGYMLSGDGHLLAFEAGDGKKDGTQAALMDLKEGKTTFFKAPRGEKITLLGFIKNDIIYGLQRADDLGMTSAGKEILPAYKLKIAAATGNVVKEYSAENIYVTSVKTEKNFVTIHRVYKENGVYTECEDDYITDTKERKEHGICLRAVYTRLWQKQMILSIPEYNSKEKLKILRSAPISDDKIIQVSFEDESDGEVYYVYGLGKLLGVYDDVVSAINKADGSGGAVISKDQSYVWERGNRDIIYYTEAEEFTAEPSQSSLDACTRALNRYGGSTADFTGCTLEQMYYIINQGAPVIMMTDAQNAVLITGYSTVNVEYIDPSDGERHYADNEEMKEMAKRGGNVFIGRIK